MYVHQYIHEPLIAEHIFHIYKDNSEYWFVYAIEAVLI